MSRASSSVKAFKQYARGGLTREDLPYFERELFGANARAACLLWVANIEEALMRAILGWMREDLSREETMAMFHGEGPLSRFSSRIRIGYALKLFGPKSRHDLDLIREIRNQVAHSFRPFRFNIPVVKQACMTLLLPDDFASGFEERTLHKARRRNLKRWRSNRDKPRDRFEIAAHALLYGLITVPILREHPHMIEMYLP